MYKVNYHGEDYDINQGIESPVLRIQQLEIAMEKAVGDIGLLQGHLTYLIDVKEQLEGEIKVKDKRLEALVKEYQRELAKKDRDIQSLRKQREQIAQLLEDARDNLNSRQAAILHHEQEYRRLHHIIQDQRHTNQALQQQLLACKFSSDLSYQSISIDNVKIQQLEKEIDMLKFQSGKLRGNLQREQARAKKAEKEAQGFKKWLGGVLGMRKVVEGCESMLMEEVENRLKNPFKF